MAISNKKNITWFPIQWFPGYECSELGIRSLNYARKWFPALLKVSCNRSGYPMVPIYKDKKMHFVTLHRIIMCNMYPCEWMDKLQVDHIDKNKMNFHPSNLRWCTVLENSNYSWADGTRRLTNILVTNNPRAMKGKFWKDHHLSKWIKYIDENWIETAYGGVREVARVLGISSSIILDFLKRNRGSYKGRKISFLYI